MKVQLVTYGDGEYSAAIIARAAIAKAEGQS